MKNISHKFPQYPIKLLFASIKIIFHRKRIKDSLAKISSTSTNLPENLAHAFTSVFIQH